MTYAPSRVENLSPRFPRIEFFKEAMMNYAKILPKSAFSSINVRLTSTSSIALDGGRAGTIAFAQSEPAVLPKRGEELRTAIDRALSSSHGTKVEDLIDTRKHVIYAIDDHTRGTPAAPALELLHERLEAAGVRDEQTTILVSAGTHRRMTEKELEAKTGSLYGRVEIVQHDCLNEAELYRAGEIDGIPIMLNKRLRDAGAVIGVGSLVAHKFSGWSGGAKIICPGLTGYETIYRCHYKSIIEERIVPGQRSNWFRSFIDRVGDLAGLKFCVNFIPTIGGIVGITAGEPRLAFEGGVSTAENSMAVYFKKKYSTVIVASFPATTDLWQSGKGFYSGELLVRDGGTLVLVTPLEEGLGDHPEFISLLEKKPAEILDLLHSGKLADPLAAVASYAIRRIGERCRLRIVTSNGSLFGRDLLGAPIQGNLDAVMDEAISEETPDLAIINDSYILPKILPAN